MLCRFLPDLVWNLKQRNILQRIFPALVLLDGEGPLSAASLVTIVSVKHFSSHNCFREIYLLSMYFKYVVSEKLTYYDMSQVSIYPVSRHNPILWPLIRTQEGNWSYRLGSKLPSNSPVIQNYLVKFPFFGGKLIPVLAKLLCTSKIYR